jgi:hypothetical protein
LSNSSQRQEPQLPAGRSNLSGLEPILSNDRSRLWSWLARLVADFYPSPLGNEDGLSEEQLQAHESRLGVALPAAVREFLQICGRRTSLFFDEDEEFGMAPTELVENDKDGLFVYGQDYDDLYFIPSGAFDQTDPLIVPYPSEEPAEQPPTFSDLAFVTTARVTCIRGRGWSTWTRLPLAEPATERLVSVLVSQTLAPLQFSCRAALNRKHSFETACGDGVVLTVERLNRPKVGRDPATGQPINLPPSAYIDVLCREQGIAEALVAATADGKWSPLALQNG